MSRRVGFISITTLAMLLTACGGGTSTTTTAPVPETVPTSPTATTSPTTVPPSTVAPTTTLAPSTTTSTTVEGGIPDFTIVQVNFGSRPFIVIQNKGLGAGSTVGHWLCQRPGYYELPDVVLLPGERLFIGVGHVPTAVGATAADDAGDALGDIVVESGEVALYYDFGGRPDFSNPEVIVDYVEWGDSGHGRSETAVAAEIWPLDAFVATTPDTLALTALTFPTTGPADWNAEIGG